MTGAALTSDRPGPPSAASLASREILVTDAEAWDHFVAIAPTGSFPQLSPWAEANEAKGWTATRIVADAPGGPVGAQVLLHRMRPGPFQRGYATRGPVAAAIDRPSLAAFTSALRRAAGEHHLSHVVIDPELEPGDAERWLAELGWHRLPVPIQIDQTRLIDLTLPEERLWSDLRSSCRWSVNRARRSGYRVADEGEAGLTAFGELYLETARRVGFEANAAFGATFRAFQRRGLGRLLIARDPDGEPAATLMLLDCGDRVIERYGASSAAGAAGRANYLVKWEAIRTSQARGMRRYDMWGTEGAGLAEFKASFGGYERRYIGAWELVTNRVVHGGFAGLARLRREGAGPAAPVTGPRTLHVTDVSATAPAGWDERAVAARGGHVMQGTAWAEHRRSQGADPRFVTFSDGRVALVILRRQRLSPGLVATCRRGPTRADLSGTELVGHIAVLGDTMHDLGARVLTVDPELDADTGYEAAMDALGARRTDEAQPSIHVMRLTFAEGATESDVFEGIQKATRQRIRAAERVGTVARYDETGERLPEFGELLVERADALGIAMRPERGYLAAWRRLIAAGQARLLLAEHQGRLAGGLLLYLQGGIHSTAYSADRVALRHELPGTMHLVRWTVIRDALAAGASAVELGGVDLPGHRDPPGPGEPNHGLYVHKASFGARWILRTPARRLVLRPGAERVAAARDGLVGLGRRAAGTLPGLPR